MSHFQPLFLSKEHTSCNAIASTYVYVHRSVCAFPTLQIIYVPIFFAPIFVRFTFAIWQNFSPDNQVAVVIRAPCSLDTNKFLTFLRAFIFLTFSHPKYKLTFVCLSTSNLLPIFSLVRPTEFLVGTATIIAKEKRFFSCCNYSRTRDA